MTTEKTLEERFDKEFPYPEGAEIWGSGITFSSNKFIDFIRSYGEEKYQEGVKKGIKIAEEQELKIAQINKDIFNKMFGS